MYTWIFENRVSKNGNLKQQNSFKGRLKAFICYLTPGSKLVVPRSIPTSPNLK